MLDLKELLKAGVHFGHKASRWSPKMLPFIWGVKNNIHLFDVSKTAFLLERAGKYLKELAKNGNSILWIGTKKPAVDIIKKHATELGMPFVVNRWVGGTLTNFDQVKKAITRYLHLKDIILRGTDRYKKKEISMIQKEIERLEKNIGGIVNLDFPPGAIIIVDAKKEHSAIREAISAGVPVVALVDSNTDPDGVNLLIPGNDDSPRSIAFVMAYLANCIQEGQKEYVQNKTAIDTEKRKNAEMKAKERNREEIKRQPIEQGQETDRKTKPELKKEIDMAEKAAEKTIEAPKKTVEKVRTEKVEVKKTTSSTAKAKTVSTVKKIAKSGLKK